MTTRRPFLLPAALGLLLTILVLLPILFMFIGSVRTGGLADPRAHFTMTKLAMVYTTWPYLRTLLQTLAVSVMVSGIACCSGVLLAWLVTRTDMPGKTVVETCIIAPLFLSPFVGALAWLILGSPKSGLINVWARAWFGATQPVINVSSATGIVLIMALFFVPYAYLTVSSSLRAIDPSMEEASYLNGAGVFGTAVRVTLPVIRPALISAFFFVFVLACGTFAIPATLARAAQLPFLAVDIYLASNIFPIDYGRSAAIGTVLFWISVMGVTAYQLASSAARRFVTVTARGYRIRLVPLRAWRTPALALVVVYVLAAIVLPYLAILFACFTRFMSASLLNAPWTLVNVTGALGAPEVMDSIENTIIVGLAAPTLCVTLGLTLAYAIRRLKVRGSRFLEYMAMFPIAVPGIVFGTGIFWTYLLTPIYGTVWVLVIAFVASYLPFAYRIGDTALLQIDSALEEASALCGASHLRTARLITLKLARPAVLTAWIMVFIFSVREISAAILLSSSDNVVLSVLTWNYLDYGDVQKAAVIGMLQTLLLGIGVVLGRYVFRVRLNRAAA